MTWARKLPTLMVCVPKRTSRITPLRLRIKCLLLLTLYDLIFLLSSKNLFKMVWWMGSQDVCLPHSLYIHYWRGIGHFFQRNKKGPRVYDFFPFATWVNVLSCAGSLPWGKWKKIYNRWFIRNFLFLCWALNSVDTRQHREIYCKKPSI